MNASDEKKGRKLRIQGFDDEYIDVGAKQKGTKKSMTAGKR